MTKTHGTWPRAPGAAGSKIGHTSNRASSVASPAFRRRFWMNLRRELHRTNSYLVPLRWFIGIGWLRAMAEKLVDSAWYKGDAVRDFVGSVTARAVTFPEFESVLQAIIVPTAPLVSWLLIALQLYCGTGILLGRSTNAALLIGMGMNVTFTLAGVPNPSAFYLMIQLVLLLSGAGATLGLDGRASAPDRSLVIAAPAERRAPRFADRWWLAGLAGTLVVISVYAFTNGTDFSPAGSVKDPALVLGLVTALGGLMVLMTLLRPFTRLELDLSEGLVNLELTRR